MPKITVGPPRPEDQTAWLSWFTAENNYRGRGFYDRVAHATPRKTYLVDTEG